MSCQNTVQLILIIIIDFNKLYNSHIGRIPLGLFVSLECYFCEFHLKKMSAKTRKQKFCSEILTLSSQIITTFLLQMLCK